jgi:hypothetical protein
MPTKGYGSALPPITVYAGITNSPLLTTPVTWTDISAYVQKIKIKRGREHVLDQFEPGQCTIEAWQKNDSALDPLNANSPYYGNLHLNTPIQVCVTFNQMTAAQTRATTGWTAGTNTTQTLTPGSATATGSVQLRANGSGSISANTPTGVSGNAIGALVPVVLQLRSTAAATNRTVTMTVTWYNSSGTSLGTSSISGTESSLVANLLGETVTPAGTAFFSVQYSVAGAVLNEIHTATNFGVLMCQSSSAVLSAAYYDGGPQPLFTGFLDQLDPVYENQMKSTPHIVASDPLRLLNDYEMPPDAAVGMALIDGAFGVWPNDDIAGSSTSRDASGNGHPLTWAPLGGAPYGSPQAFGQSPRNATTLGTTMLGAANTAAAIPGVYTFGAAPQIAAGSGSWSVEVWFKTTNANETIFYQVNGAGHQQISLYISSGKVTGSVSNSAGTVLGTAQTAGTYADGNWHWAVFAYSATFTEILLYVDAAEAIAVGSISLTLDSGSAGVFQAIGSRSVMALYNSDITGNANKHYYAGIQVFDGISTLSGYRIKNALDLSGWPGGWINSGVSSVGLSHIQQPTSAFSNTSALTYCQQVALAENGYFFAGRDGLLQFLDRHTITIPVAQGTAGAVKFGDVAAQGEIRYKRNPDVGLDNVDFGNGSTVGRAGGNTQYVDPSQASVNTYGVKRYVTETGLLITTDQEALYRAQYNVRQFGTPKVRVRSIDVDVIAPGNPSAVVAFAAAGSVSPLDLTSTVTFIRRPYTKDHGFNDGVAVSSPLFSQISMVEGIDHDIDLAARKWTATVHCAPADTTVYWILNSSALGTDTVLAY